METSTHMIMWDTQGQDPRDCPVSTLSILHLYSSWWSKLLLKVAWFWFCYFPTWKELGKLYSRNLDRIWDVLQDAAKDACCFLLFSVRSGAKWMSNEGGEDQRQSPTPLLLSAHYITGTSPQVPYPYVPNFDVIFLNLCMILSLVGKLAN